MDSKDGGGDRDRLRRLDTGVFKEREPPIAGDTTVPVTLRRRQSTSRYARRYALIEHSI